MLFQGPQKSKASWKYEGEIAPEHGEAVLLQHPDGPERGQRDGIAIERDAMHDPPGSRVPNVVFPQGEEGGGRHPAEEGGAPTAPPGVPAAPSL